MTMSRGQSGPQNAVTASAASSICGGDAGQQRRRVRSAETDEVNRAAVVQRLACVDAAVGVVSEAGAGHAPGARGAGCGLPTRSSAQISSATRRAPSCGGDGQ